MPCGSTRPLEAPESRHRTQSAHVSFAAHRLRRHRRRSGKRRRARIAPRHGASGSVGLQGGCLMALREVRIPVRFVGGISTKQDPKTVALTHMITLENGVFTKPGTIGKRTGYESL